MKSFAIAALAGCAAAAAADDWGYNNLGKDWKGQCATGKHQSPIDLNKEAKHIVSNSGHALKV